MDSDPRTNKEWFLYNLFTDTDFARIRDEALERLEKIDPVGMSKLIGRGTDIYSNDIIQGAVNQLVEEFKIREVRDEYSSEVFGHDCPVYYHAEGPVEEDSDQKLSIQPKK